jgi:hypothetical protein
MFYGILIKMFFYDTDKHKLPHVHAEYQGQVAFYAIHDGVLLAGELPLKNISWLLRGLKYIKMI